MEDEEASSGEWPISSDGFVPDDAASMPPATSSDTAPRSNSAARSRYKGVWHCMLPYAKGSQNYFLGEVNDAAEISALSVPYYFYRCPSTVLQGETKVFSHRLSWSILRSFSLSGPILLMLIPLSMSGYDYRRYGSDASTNPKVVEYLKDWEGRSEHRAEKWTRNGLVVGAIAGSMMAREMATIALVRPVPMFIGFTIFSGSIMNCVNHEIYRQFRI
ncbi:allantoinase [Physcia stellaris]|nr:allantoinase [Physcia stellaris]